MTRKEAIKIIESWVICMNCEYPNCNERGIKCPHYIETEKFYEALEVAISSMKTLNNIKDSIFKHQKACVENTFNEECEKCYDILFNSIYNILDKNLNKENDFYAHWEKSSNGWKCSNCGEEKKYGTRYCPDCGKYMVIE